jgi:hypothetical protein
VFIDQREQFSWNNDPRPDCTFDNPVTWQREKWRGGELIAYCTAEFIIKNYPVDATFRVGGDWKPGRVIGDEKAMLKDGEPCSHPGCAHHLTHPCERCGRVAAICKKEG